MSKLRITPLNLVSAMLLTWLFWRIMEGDYTWGWVGLMFVLLIAVVLADQFFRIMLRSLRRVWILEGVFVLIVAVVVWVIRLWT